MPRSLKSKAMLRMLSPRSTRAGSLLDRLGLGRLDLFADDAIPPSPTLAQIMAVDLVAERPRPAAGSLARSGIALDLRLSRAGS
jgi:hypothetical protein